MSACTVFSYCSVGVGHTVFSGPFFFTKKKTTVRSTAACRGWGEAASLEIVRSDLFSRALSLFPFGRGKVATQGQRKMTRQFAGCWRFCITIWIPGGDVSLVEVAASGIRLSEFVFTIYIIGGERLKGSRHWERIFLLLGLLWKLLQGCVSKSWPLSSPSNCL